MRKSILTVIIAVLAVFGSIAKAQNNVYDIITLKDGKGIVKGFINEQVLGQSIKIIPDEAILQIDYKDIAGVPTKKSIKTDSTTVETDVVVLKNGQTIEGKIVERAPDKWIVISASKLPEQTYPLESIEKIGKGISGSKNDIFNEYGVLDVLITKDGTVSKGIIIEQTFGKTVKIKTPDKSILVYDIEDIATVSREAYDPSKDIFKQSAFLDVIHKVKGGTARGIIIRQVLGESVIVEFPSSGGNSDPILYTDIKKISREINQFKEKNEPAVQVVAVDEPDSVGIFFYKDNNINRQINAYTFQRTRNNDFIKFIDAPRKAIDVFKVNKELILMVKVEGNVDDILPSIKVWDVTINMDKQPKSINLQQTADAIEEYFSSTQSKVSIKVEKYGHSSIRLTITPRKTGEYAITYKGCQKITVFGVE